MLKVQAAENSALHLFIQMKGKLFHPPFAHIVEIVLVSSVTPEIRLVEWTTVLP